MSCFVINHVKVVTPLEVIDNGSVLIRDGLIASIGLTSLHKIPSGCSIINGYGKWLLPGLIDLHNDSIEKEIEPRPNALFPIEIAFFSLESRLLSHGVTSIYHSLSFAEGGSVIRSEDKVVENVNAINSLKKHGTIRHYIHARYDITDKNFCPLLIDMINKKQIQLLSFMDHTPGQGQYKKIGEFESFVKKYRNLNDIEVKELIEMRMEKSRSFNAIEFVDMLAQMAQRHGLPIASHDDDSKEKVLFMRSKGVTISEFPIDMDSAVCAANEGMHVVVGAPNIIRGISNSGNMRAIDAIKNNAVDIICSDYMSSSMLHAVFHLYHRHGYSIVDAVKFAATSPAKAVGIDKSLGSIECGKSADLVLINEINEIPFVEQVFVEGCRVLQKGNCAANEDAFEKYI